MRKIWILALIITTLVGSIVAIDRLNWRTKLSLNRTVAGHPTVELGDIIDDIISATDDDTDTLVSESLDSTDTLWGSRNSALLHDVSEGDPGWVIGQWSRSIFARDDTDTTAINTNIIGLYAEGIHDGTSTLSEITALRTGIGIGTTGTATTAYSVYIEDGTAGSGGFATQYGIFIEDIDAATNANYSIYSTGGNVEIHDGYFKADTVYIPNGTSYPSPTALGYTPVWIDTSGTVQLKALIDGSVQTIDFTSP